MKSFVFNDLKIAVVGRDTWAFSISARLSQHHNDTYFMLIFLIRGNKAVTVVKQLDWLISVLGLEKWQ